MKKIKNGLIQIESKNELMALAKMAKATNDSFKEEFKEMTIERAKEIRKKRVDEGYSWRAIASEFGGGGNQLAGMALCEIAAELFGEDYMQGEWN